ncbi:MAG TPA: HNH endonuclease [Candidatus Latescibacteria bacterium]|nr:HNH endonuclease [Candidatus Latescibacterota bacterium]
MECTRAAVVDYRALCEPPDFSGDAVAEQTRFPIAIEARVLQHLLPREGVSPAWASDFGRILSDSEAIPVTTVDAVLVPDDTLTEDLRVSLEELDGIAQRWGTVVAHLITAVPKKTLSSIVHQYLAAEDEQVLRFGQQVEKVLALPEDAGSLERCLAVIDHLGAWVDRPAMCDIADVAYRLRMRIDEDRALLRQETERQIAEAPAKALDEFRAQTAVGFCLPEQRMAFRGDTLFVFDGEYPAAEMYVLISEYMAELEKRFTAAAIDRDLFRQAAEAEQPASIPDRVRSIVWRRDNGKCAMCGGTTDLEFDHIIPKSQGGASTVANVQVLCVRCNERKGAQVAWLPFPRAHRTSEDTLDLFRTPLPPRMERDSTC